MNNSKIFWYKAVFSVFILSYAMCSVAESLSEVPISINGQNSFLAEERKGLTSDYLSSIAPGDIPPDANFKKVLSCNLNGPAEVQGYRVQCSNASFLEFSISDGFIPNDHWSLKGKNWDKAPNTATTTSPGKVIQYGSSARVYNYGGTNTRKGNIDTYLQCTYLHGVDIFPASSFIMLGSDASNCSVSPDKIRSRIDRMP